MEIAFLGETCALLAAVCWALALVLFKRSGESISPLSLSLFKNTIGIVLLVLTLPIVGEGVSTLAAMDPRDVYILLLSGVVGIAIADTMLFYALNLIGVGLLTISECVYTPSVMAFGWLFLRERIGVGGYVGAALVLLALFISSKHEPPPGRTRGQVAFGMLVAAVSVSMMALGIVIAKPIIEVTPLFTAATIRVVGGTAVLAVIMAASPRRRALYAVFKPSKVWRHALPGSVLGMYLAMLLWVAGFKYTDASIAAILNQTSTVFALIFATLFLKEAFTRRKFVAACSALGGVLVVLVWRST